MATTPDGNQIVQVRTQGSEKARYYSLLIPPEIGRMIAPNAQFALKLTDEGLLYAPVSPSEQVPETLPGWLTEMTAAAT